MDLKKEAAREAIQFISDHTIIGLGAGATIAHIIEFLRQAANQGQLTHLRVASPSLETRKLLSEHGYISQEISKLSRLDLYLDSCDQFDEDLNALKSGGGIHTQEKLFASMSEAFVLVADDSKFVSQFDGRYPLTIEVIPEALGFVTRALENFFVFEKMEARKVGISDDLLLTSNKNHLIDKWFYRWPSLSTVNPILKTIAGVLDNSLFFDMAKVAVVAGEYGTRVLRKNAISVT